MTRNVKSVRTRIAVALGAVLLTTAPAAAADVIQADKEKLTLKDSIAKAVEGK